MDNAVTHYLDIKKALRLLSDRDGSDLFINADAPAFIKVEGQMIPLGDQPLGTELVKDIAYFLMKEEQAEEFEKELEMNFGLTLLGDERFRINIMYQRGDISIVIRYIKGQIPSIEELGLPESLRELIMAKQGLILVVGGTGSGKSTSLASMIDYRNRNHAGHILTIEDPIEFAHEFKKSVINQREVGVDTHSYANALKNAMREAPDLILIGEILDQETMHQALRFAKAGHLCLSTLHANNSVQTLDRIISFFAAESREQILMDLSLNLRAVICQRLILGLDQKRVAAVEVLQPTPYMRELILKGHFDDVIKAMREANEPGIQTFDKSLFELFEAGKISREEALKNVDPSSDLALNIRLSGEEEQAMGEFELDEDLM